MSKMRERQQKKTSIKHRRSPNKMIQTKASPPTNLTLFDLSGAPPGNGEEDKTHEKTQNDDPTAEDLLTIENFQREFFSNLGGMEEQIEKEIKRAKKQAQARDRCIRQQARVTRTRKSTIKYQGHPTEGPRRRGLSRRQSKEARRLLKIYQKISADDSGSEC
jgi:hypothetical protein